MTKRGGLTVAEAAAWFGHTPELIRTWLHRGKIARRDDGLIDPIEMQAWANQRDMERAKRAEIHQAAQRRKPAC